MFDVGARLAATGEHQCGLGQDLAPVVQREPFTGDRDACADSELPRPKPVGERAKPVQPDMGLDTLAGPFHHDRNRAVSVHFASAVQSRDSDASTTSGSLPWSALPLIGSPFAHEAT